MADVIDFLDNIQIVEESSNKVVLDMDIFEGIDEGITDGESLSTQQERIQSIGDTLIRGYILAEGEDILRMRSLLFSQSNGDMFREENHILYKILYKFRDKGFKPDEEFLRLYMMRNQSVVSGKIDLYKHGDIDGNVQIGYASGVLKHFRGINGGEKVSWDDYQLVYEKYVVEFETIEFQTILGESNQILFDGRKGTGGKLLQGFKDSSDHLKRGIARIEGLVDRKQGTGFTSLQDLIIHPDEQHSPNKVADWGYIDELNQHTGGIFTQQLITILAPLKSGKSKFCTRIIHTSMVKYKQNITVWCPEGGPRGFESQLRAIHFDYTYNEMVGSYAQKQLGVSQESVLYDRFPSKELKELEYASAVELASNPEYGNVDVIDRPFELETFLESIDTSVKSNGSSFIFIDYMQQLRSRNSRKSLQEILKTAYPMLLDYCKKNNVACISPAQYTQEAIKDLSKTGTSGKDMRTAGGESSEILRSSDVIVSLWASTEDLINNRMKILSTPGRFSAPLEPIDIFVDLGTCNFISIQGGEENVV